MKKTNFKKILSFIVCIVLVAAMALMTSGCLNDEIVADGKTRSFTFTVIHKNGDQKQFEITTQKATVGEALEDEGLIEGEEDQYGLYVNTVDGETLDYTADGYWWGFYIGEEMAPTGVDKTAVEDGVNYSFRAEKA